MTYNLTNKQKDLARFIVEQVRSGKLQESFAVFDEEFDRLTFSSSGNEVPAPKGWSEQDLFVLASEDLIRSQYNKEKTGPNSTSVQHICTLKGAIYRAVDSNFSDSLANIPISALASSHPPEIAMSIDRLRERYPDPKKVGFLIMRFAAEKPYAAIVDAIKKTADKYGVKVVRADEQEFHRNLLSNVRTYLHGCGFGIAIYERITTDEPNANVGLEVGYLMAMNKPVLLLKDKTVETLQTDLAGELYKEFDPHDPEGTIPAQLTKWLEDYGIIVSKRIAVPDNSPAL